MPYQEGDCKRIRDFLVATHATKRNWSIDRWNFTRSFSQTMHNTLESFPSTVGIWVDEKDQIVAVVNSEGENRGEAFFQLAHQEFSKKQCGIFLDHAEEYLMTEMEGKRVLNLRVPEGFSTLSDLVYARGYVVQEEVESTSCLELEGEYPVKIPAGLHWMDGQSVSAFQMGFAHGRAFGYYKGKNPDDDDGERSFLAVRQALDYRSSLELSLVNEAGEVVAFALFWYDEVNQMGILEPLGTIPEYRGLGLAKALVHEGIRRIRPLGARRLYVGSDQPFYLSLGFQVVYTHGIWQLVRA